MYQLYSIEKIKGCIQGILYSIYVHTKNDFNAFLCFSWSVKATPMIYKDLIVKAEERKQSAYGAYPTHSTECGKVQGVAKYTVMGVAQEEGNLFMLAM